MSIYHTPILSTLLTPSLCHAEKSIYHYPLLYHVTLVEDIATLIAIMVTLILLSPLYCSHPYIEFNLILSSPLYDVTFWHLWHSWHCDILDHLWISSQLQVRSSGLPQTLLHYQSSISDLNSACRWLLDTTHSLHIIIVSQVLLFVSCPPWSTFLHSFLTPSASTPRESQTPCNHYTHTAEDNSLCNPPCWKLENLWIPLEKSDTLGIEPGPSSCLTNCTTRVHQYHPSYIYLTTSIFFLIIIMCQLQLSIYYSFSARFWWFYHHSTGLH